MKEKFDRCVTTKYKLETVDGVICLTDLGEGSSITNNAENVAAQLMENGHNLMECPVIYRDAEGYWDWIKVTILGGFSHFKSLGGLRDRAKAIGAVQELAWYGIKPVAIV